jgi:thermitase
MSIWLGGVILLAALLLGYWLARQFRRPKEPVFVPGQLIVKFVEDTPEEAISRIHKKLKGKVLEKNADLGFHVVGTGRKIERMVRRYRKFREVEYAEPNYLFKAFYVPNDSYYSYQYGPQKIDAPPAWDVTSGNPQVKIAVVDTGIQLNHPDLAGKIVAGRDFVQNDDIPDDENGHGTHVAGIAAAVTNDGIGIAGVAPNVSLMPVRVLDSSGAGSLSAVANGILYAANQGAQVINLSLGAPQGAYSLLYAVTYAWNKGSVIVAAAGNDGAEEPNYPAYYPNVIAVASTDSSDRRSSFSNYGQWVDVAAPGSDILSTYLGSRYAYLSGTSMASPHVAGLAALLASQGRTNAQVVEAIRKGADPIPGTGTNWLYGRVNAYRSVRS